jgi:tetratricopeptide (TPR) repeat protein
MQIPKYLLDQIREGNVVLFLGSGSSVGAVHPQHEKIPIGQQLSNLIAEKFLDKAYLDQPLQYVAELAINESDLFTVQKFISDIFRTFKPSHFHKLIPTFSWKSIITTNYDLLIEDAYDSVQNPPQELAIFVKDGERVRDKITSPRSLPYYKIHGSIDHINDLSLPLILTPEQFITHKENRERLFSRILELGRDYTFLFIGFGFADYDIRLMLLELEKLKEGKPRSYMVGPYIKDEETRLWDKRKVTSIKCTLEDFLTELDRNLDKTFRAISIARPRNLLPIHSKFVVDLESLKPSENFQSFIENDVDFINTALTAPTTDPKAFYKGYFENWSPILGDLDVRRTIIDGILSEAILSDTHNTAVSQNLFLIKGYAGSGKSVVLKRLAWDAGTTFEKLCLVYKPNVFLKYEPLAELFNYCKERIYLFIDNAFANSDGIQNLLYRAKKDRVPLTVITTERINVWNSDCEDLQSLVTQEYQLRYLNDKEIVGLIDLLEKHNSLNNLRTKSLIERIEAFAEQAGRELLVALYEATSGKPFAQIIKDEYESISNETARSLYLTVSILHRLGAETRAGFISRVHGIAFNEFKEKLFKPLEFIVFDRRDYRIGDYVYLTRHKHIAEIIFEEVLVDAQDRFDEYLRIIQHLDVDYDGDRIAFFAMTNAKKLMAIFNDPNMIRSLYAEAKLTSKNDAKLFQQEAIFEMTSKGGVFKNAETYLHEAYKLSPGDPIISHSFAEFGLKKAEKSVHRLESEKYLNEAQEICEELIKKNNDGLHPYHTLLKIQLLKLTYVLESKDSPAIERSIKNIEKTLSQAKQYHPEEQFILEAESNFNDLINNKPEALALLIKAFEVNKSSPFIALRLANVYEFNEQFDEGIKVLKEALSINPAEKDLNFKYAILLSKKDVVDYSEIKHFLRRAFTMGDSRFQAQFWYARCLYLLHEHIEAKKIFEVLDRANIDIKIKNEPRGSLKVDGITIKYTGRIIDTEMNHGFIKRDEIADDIYFYRYHEEYNNWDEFKRGVRVQFTLAFNYRGPIGLNVKKVVY